MAKQINIKELEQYYSITEHGEVYSKLRERYLRPYLNNFGYFYYSLKTDSGRDQFSCHSLVAAKFIGPRPEGYDIDHIDGEKGNNHYTNLQYLTRSQNVRKDYASGKRVCYWKGQVKPSPSLETRMLMADAKKKPVKVVYNGVTTVYDSIDHCAKSLGWYREKVYRALKQYTYKDMKFSYVDNREKPPK